MEKECLSCNNIDEIGCVCAEECNNFDQWSLDINYAEKKLLEFLEGSRRKHYYCEDSYYNCSKHPDELEFCINPEDIECECGADDYNKEFDEIILLVKQYIDV